MSDVKEKLGSRIKKLRLQNNFSQEKLAELADLDRTYIPGIESGKRNVSVEVLKKISNVFEISISELTEGI